MNHTPRMKLPPDIEQASVDAAIEREYALIQKKESKLSANKRRWVVRQYGIRHGKQ